MSAGMRELKEKNCDAQPIASAVKKVLGIIIISKYKIFSKIRNNCISVFLECKRAEDMAVSLVATCGKGEVRTEDGRKINGIPSS